MCPRNVLHSSSSFRIVHHCSHSFTADQATFSNCDFVSKPIFDTFPDILDFLLFSNHYHFRVHIGVPHPSWTLSAPVFTYDFNKIYVHPCCLPIYLIILSTYILSFPFTLYPRNLRSFFLKAVFRSSVAVLAFSSLEVSRTAVFALWNT